MKCFKYILILLSLFTANLYAQSIYNIDYYGVVSSDIDSNIYKMTSDLYYTQLSEINSFSVSDKRGNLQLKEEPEHETFSLTALSFYAIIEKKSDTLWTTTYILIDKKNNATKTEVKEFDSYYKILMEPKSVLQDSLKKLITSKTSGSTEVAAPAPQESTGLPVSSTEFLSGTWGGEAGVSKIVIMRGGRGFVIFENGASMNVNLDITSSNGISKILITQNGKSNASFFPEIPRQIALTAAISSEPIQWIFTLSDDNTLTGTKNTLILKGNEAVAGTVEVTWTRRN